MFVLSSYAKMMGCFVDVAQYILSVTSRMGH